MTYFSYNRVNTKIDDKDVLVINLCCFFLLIFLYFIYCLNNWQKTAKYKKQMYWLLFKNITNKKRPKTVKEMWSFYDHKFSISFLFKFKCVRENYV